MANNKLIPAKDEQFNSFQSNLITQVTENATDWQITVLVITALTALQTVWAAAWANWVDESKRTKSVTQAKNTARKDYEAAMRKFIQKWIYDNEVMTAADIILCGLKPRDTIRTSVPIPDTVPVVEFSVMSGHRLKARVTQQPDALGVTSRAKPKGVAKLEMVYIMNPEGTVPPEECDQQVFSTKTIFEIQFTMQQAGVRLMGYARWVNAKEQAGPWGEVFTAIVP